MNVDTELCITLNAEEAVQLRTALHIATRLTAVAPEPFNRPIFAAHFDKLHDSLRDAGIDVLDGTIDFSEAIIRSLKDSIYSTDSLRGGMRGAELQQFFTQSFGMREMDFAAIEARVMASLLDPLPPIVLDASQLPFEVKGTLTGRLPPKPQEQNLPRFPWVVEANFPVSGWKPSMQAGLHCEFFQTAQAAGEAAQKYCCRGVEYRVRNRDTDESMPVNLLKAKSPKQWIIQYRHDNGAVPGNWERIQGRSDYPGVGAYSTRNEAYRQMRARIEKMGYPAERYRVVPSDTPDGPEPNRGYYLVEYWKPHARQWVNTSGGPGFGNRASAEGVYYSAVTAQEDIKVHGFDNITYRVKWHPNKS